MCFVYASVWSCNLGCKVQFLAPYLADLFLNINPCCFGSTIKEELLCDNPLWSSLRQLTYAGSFFHLLLYVVISSKDIVEVVCVIVSVEI
jgi:hypothetical protein